MKTETWCFPLKKGKNKEKKKKAPFDNAMIKIQVIASKFVPCWMFYEFSLKSNKYQ